MEIGISGSENLPRPGPPSWSRLSAVLSTLALVAVMGGSPPLVGDGTESAADTRADASSWSPLPAGFLPGDGRILIERDGTVLRADFPKSFDVVGHQEARVRVGGDLSFSLVGRGDGGAGATLTILRLGTPGDRIAVNVIVEVRLRVQESVVPARMSRTSFSVSSLSPTLLR